MRIIENHNLRAENDRLKESVHGLGIDLEAKLSAINAHHLIDWIKAQDISALKTILRELCEKMEAGIIGEQETKRARALLEKLA